MIGKLRALQNDDFDNILTQFACLSTKLDRSPLKYNFARQRSLLDLERLLSYVAPTSAI